MLVAKASPSELGDVQVLRCLWIECKHEEAVCTNVKTAKSLGCDQHSIFSTTMGGTAKISINLLIRHSDYTASLCTVDLQNQIRSYKQSRD